MDRRPRGRRRRGAAATERWRGSPSMVTDTRGLGRMGWASSGSTSGSSGSQRMSGSRAPLSTDGWTDAGAGSVVVSPMSARPRGDRRGGPELGAGAGGRTAPDRCLVSCAQRRQIEQAPGRSLLADEQLFDVLVCGAMARGSPSRALRGRPHHAADTIVIRGAREHNLCDVSVELPRDELIVFTGLSGSGKSSLAFDTIYAEGQRRYVESLVGLRPAVPRADGQARRRRDRGPVAGHLDRPEVGIAQPAVDGRHRHRGLRLPAAPVRPGRRPT